MEPKRFPDNIFFFGAGASVAAGVETTFGLVNEFNNSLKNKPVLLSLLNEILVILQSKDHKIDIEDLLETIDRLEKKDNDILLKFYNFKDFKLSNPSELPSLKNELRGFITRVTSVKKENINYLEPLFSLQKPVRIFSVNYDTAVEQLCNVYKKSYTDGFDYSWNPSLFENDKLDFQIYKLHGSILWYKTEKGEYLKLPLPPTSDKINLIFGDKASHFMLYPMQKWEFDEPMLEMVQRFRASLEEAEAVIVVGYSFRDPYIVKIFHDAAIKNQRLFVFLVDPDARQIYETKLRYYNFEGENNRIPSSLQDRVVCLQYPFETLLPVLQGYVYAVTRNGFVLEDRYHQDSYAGRKSEWFKNGPISYYSQSEFIDRIDLLFEKVDWDEEIANDPVGIMFQSLKMLVVAEEHFRDASRWWEIFRKASSVLSPSKLDVSYDSNRKSFAFSFRKNRSTSFPFNAFSMPVTTLLEFFHRKETKMEKQSLSFELKNKFRNLYNYVIARTDYVKIEDLGEIKDGIEYNDKSLVLGYREALAKYENNMNDVHLEELIKSCKHLEKFRLNSIIGADTFNEYFLNKLEQEETRYSKYIQKI